jgi:tRNA A-37 threonylcarbamoyl transferase component Bud32
MDFSIPKDKLRAEGSVFPIETPDGIVYVKQRRAAKNPLGRMAQTALYRLTGNLLVLPTGRHESDPLAAECAKIRRLGGMGIPVPTILHEGDGYFVMSYVGRTLQKTLKRRRGEASVFAERAVRELRRLHDLGEAHGGAQIKNLTLLDDVIHFLDFEEDIPEGNLREFQLRDLFLLILSLERHRHDPDLVGLCRLYENNRSDSALAGICESLLRIRHIRLLESRAFDFLSMRDIRSLNRLIAKAETAIAARPAAAAQPPLPENI